MGETPRPNRSDIIASPVLCGDAKAFGENSMVSLPRVSFNARASKVMLPGDNITSDNIIVLGMKNPREGLTTPLLAAK